LTTKHYCNDYQFLHIFHSYSELSQVVKGEALEIAVAASSLLSCHQPTAAQH